MERYEFEVLTDIQRQGNVENNPRMISNRVKISVTAVLQATEQLQKLGYLSLSDGLLTVTPAGLAALQPYRVERAIILAAGFGSRMLPATADRPKPLVTVNGRAILETLLDALVAAGITDITVVRGYQKQSFDRLLLKYPFLRLVDNDLFASTNNISSVMQVLPRLHRCYLCEADLYLSNPGVITKYQYASNILGSYSLQTDDWSFKRDENGYITSYQKGNTYCYNYYGISFWTEEDCARLRRDFADVYGNYQNGTDYFWEFIPLVLKKQDYRVEIRPCEKTDIVEIDSFEELAQLDASYRL